MKRCDKKGQVWYFTSVMLVFIGFAFFGLLILANHSITGNLISDVNVPSSCSDSSISQIWDDIFLESSIGISIIKNDTIFAGKCAEYFAYKINSNNENLSYILHGFTVVEAGANVSYILAERINSTTYSNFLSGINSIEDVSSLPTKDSSFFSNNVFSRQGTIPTTSNANSIFNKTFEISLSQSWETDTYLGANSISFLNNLSNNTNVVSSQGQLLVNYDYSSFGYVSTPIKQNICEESLNCEDWSDCLNGTQNRTCLEIVCEAGEEISGEVFENQTCTQGSCVLNWSVGNWSDCINGTQTRVVIDLNNCGTNSSKPSTNINCAGCTPDWECTGWYPIICPTTGFQNRNCTDNNACDADSLVKSETQSCDISLDTTSTTSSNSQSGTSSNSSSNLFFIILIVIVVLIIIGLIIWLIFSLKQKDGVDNSKKDISKNPPFSSSKIPFTKKISSPVKRIIPQRFRRQLSAPKTFTKPIAKISQKPINNKFPKINENAFSKVQTKPMKKFEQKLTFKRDTTKNQVKSVNTNFPKSKNSKDVWSSLRDIGGLSSKNKQKK